MARAHRGGKEEIRASALKTYLLRARAEKGDRAVSLLLEGVGIDPAAVDSETHWLSGEAMKRALRSLRGLLGETSLENLGDWVTHPEALGTRVRMMRVTRVPIDAYRYIVDSARETTRIGTWEIEEGILGSAGESGTPASGGDGAGALPSAPRKRPADSIGMTYRIRTEAAEEGEPLDEEGEELLCAARRGELASLPRIWGLADAEVTHPICLAKAGSACVYEVRWHPSRERRGLPLGALAGGAVCGLSVGLAGGWLAAGLASALGAVLAGGAGYLWDKSQNDRAGRAFEQNRIAALERGLELRGELGSTPGDLTGSVLGGKYRIGKKLGSGGIGVVYAAEHLGLGHEVAIKVLRGAAARDGGEIARLRREAYIQVHVDHPNVARVLDLDQMPDGSIYVVMEKLVGRSLADKLAREGLVTPGLAIPMFVGVCGALAAAHSKGVVHRDLKPGNVFLCEDGTSKVLDFGMSKLSTAESLTQAGYTLGTPEYMAPEQCIGGAVEARTDIYALGVLMYEALTGELPIIAQSRRELLDLHQRQVPRSMRVRRPDLPIPQELDLAVMMCLKKRVSDRPRNAEELERMLQAIPCEGLPLSYPPGVGRRSPRPEAKTAPALVSDAPPKP
jgi:eukaryotic-like serine/threonine-protein kinase